MSGLKVTPSAPVMISTDPSFDTRARVTLARTPFRFCAFSVALKLFVSGFSVTTAEPVPLDVELGLGHGDGPLSSVPLALVAATASAQIPARNNDAMAIRRMTLFISNLP